MKPFERRLHLNTGLLDKKPVRYLNDYAPAASLVAVEQLSSHVLNLGGHIMQQWKGLGVPGLTGAEALPFKIQCAGDGSVLRKSFLRDVSVAVMAGITALEILDYEVGRSDEEKETAMRGTIVGNCLLAGANGNPERLDVIMGLVAEAACRKIYQLHKNTVSIQFRCAESAGSSGISALDSPVLPHVILYSGCSPVLITEVLHHVLSLLSLNEWEIFLCHHMWQQDGSEGLASMS